MASDIRSSLLNLLMQGTGNDTNVWMNNFNSQVILLLENAIAGNTQVVSGSNQNFFDSPYTALTTVTDGSIIQQVRLVSARSANPTFWLINNKCVSSPVELEVAPSLLGQGITIPSGLHLVFYDGTGPGRPASLSIK